MKDGTPLGIDAAHFGHHCFLAHSILHLFDPVRLTIHRTVPMKNQARARLYQAKVSHLVVLSAPLREGITTSGAESVPDE